MTVTRLALGAAALAAVFVVAACGGGGATTAPTQASSPVPEMPSLDRPTFDLSSLDLSSFAIPSFAIPSFTSDEELEALLPDSIGGQAVVKQSLTGPAVLTSPFGAAPAIEGMLADVGASIDDMSLGIGSATAPAGTTLVILAYQVDGVSAERIFDGLQSAFPSGSAPQVSQLTVAGRKVAQFVVAGETTYIYLTGDVVFIIGGTVTPELLADAVSQLPAP